MGFSYKTYSETKDIMKKYVNATEGAIIYGISKSHLMTLVNEAGALYKVGNTAVVNVRFCPQSVRGFCPEVAGFNAGTYEVPAYVL